MKMRELLFVGCVAFAAVLSPQGARAQGAGRAPPQEQAGQADEEPRNPHAGRQAASAGGMGDIPEDSAVDDPAVAKASIDVHIVDPSGAPLPHAEVTLGILYNSVAKGESRKRVTTTSDDAGTAKFKDLDTGTGVAYRPMVVRDGATFSVTPFQLGPKSGVRALLHVYPVVSELEETLVVSQSMVYAEVKDDRIQIQQAFRIYNFGKTAWVPANLVIPLPETFTAFATQQGMTDVGVDAVPNKGLKLRGTFAPGQHIVEFKWQLPYSGEGEVKFDVGMPPNVAAARVVAPASKGMGMDVEGFDSTKPTTDGTGQRVLYTEKQIRRDEPALKSVTIAIKGLPTEGPGKVLATFLALSGLVVGIVLGTRKPPPRDTKRERRQLLAAMGSLEAGHLDGQIGPKTYERARRELIDDIARTFASASPAASSASSGPAATKKAPRKKRA